MRLIYLPLLILLPLFNIPLTDTIDRIAQLIAKGNTAELATLFAPNVDITILDQENVYSGTQAEIILQRFFTQNKPISSKILHKVNSNANYGFGVIILTTDKGPYRVAFTLKGINGTMQLIELRIETEKVR